MADMFDKEKRSSIMKKIRSKGIKTTELKLMQIFRELGVKGWHRGYPVKGHPDFVFLKKKVAVFVDGCFWHGHNCRNTHPKENEEYWLAKLENNARRDHEITALFESRGWTVLRIWECELMKKNREGLVEKIKAVLNK